MSEIAKRYYGQASMPVTGNHPEPPQPAQECDHDFSGVGVATVYKGVYREKCRKCGALGEEYEKDYT